VVPSLSTTRARSVLVDGCDGGVEADLGAVAYRFVQRRHQVAAKNCHGPFAEGGCGDGGRHGELGTSVGVDQDGGEQAQIAGGQRGEQAEAFAPSS
jgi:hypothetical protein